jgi:hypothetical protein
MPLLERHERAFSARVVIENVFGRFKLKHSLGAALYLDSRHNIALLVVNLEEEF